MWQKLILSFLIICISLFIFPLHVNAVTLTISNVPSLITPSDEFTINIVISGAASGTNYLKIDLYKSGTTNYFGETFTGSEWYSGPDGTKYLPITIQSGIDWNGSVRGKIGNPTIIQFDGVGQYKVRVRRYTGSGNYNSQEANNGAIDIQIVTPTENPTPTITDSNEPDPTETTIPEPTPTMTQTNITTTPSPIPILTPTPQSYSGIYISEVMVNPETNDHEWIELYNDNDSVVYLTDWFIDDIPDGGSSPKKFSLVINPKNYGVVEITSSIFNNDEDSIRLLDFDGKEKDNLQYESAEKGKTLGRKSLSAKDICIQEPTKGSSNKKCAITIATETKEPTSKPSPTPTKIIISSPPHLTLTLTPSSFLGLFSQPENNLLEKSPNNNNILGVTINKTDRNNQLYRVTSSSLSLASLLYSLLAISSIVLKVKKNI